MSEPAPVWDPWRAAEDRGVVVRVDPVADLLGGGLAVTWDGVEIIVLSPSLDSATRRAVLAHELIHLERGRGIDEPEMPPTWSAEVAREESAVDDEVARRLVPAGRLHDAVHAGDGTAAALADALEVPVEVILRAASLLRACSDVSGARVGEPGDRQRRAS